MSRLVNRCILATLALLAVAAPASARDVDFGETARLVAAAPGVDANVRRCWFAAFITDRDPSGTNIRAAPSPRGRVLRRIPNSRFEAGERVAPEMRVLGSRNGWFLVSDVGWGGYDLPASTLFPGVGWIVGSRLSAVFEHPHLLAEPRLESARLAPLYGELPNGHVFGSDSLPPPRLHDCTGSMVEVTYQLPGRGPMRGWAHGACANQVTTCGGGQRLVVENQGRLKWSDED